MTQSEAQALRPSDTLAHHGCEYGTVGNIGISQVFGHSYVVDIQIACRDGSKPVLRSTDVLWQHLDKL